MASLLRAYNAVLIRRPMLAQCATGGFLFGFGDVIAQQLVEGRGKDHDFTRTVRLGFYGGIMFAPIMTKWYQFLNRLQFNTPSKALVYRVYLDQAVFSPAAVVFFFGSMSVLEGKGLGGATDKISHAYVPTLLRNWAVYIPTQVINFTVIPSHLRFVFVGVVSLFWNTYLSSVNAREQRLYDAEHGTEKPAEAWT
ncbi:hypothetical protein BDM02DRAFT_3183395 [Thelephora ganbajun]|uniref:Uncharacterized protein n=1 Tax=Thelephora ganbajun TaxID=370292 RepID=A0ACB6ZTB5_THEGA|nr:hypothetical protein BDM02DRAFT_3183395 [Thelephora ganbajun]